MNMQLMFSLVLQLRTSGYVNTGSSSTEGVL